MAQKYNLHVTWDDSDDQNSPKQVAKWAKKNKLAVKTWNVKEYKGKNPQPHGYHYTFTGTKKAILGNDAFTSYGEKDLKKVRVIKKAK